MYQPNVLYAYVCVYLQHVSISEGVSGYGAVTMEEHTINVAMVFMLFEAMCSGQIPGTLPN